MRTGDTSRGVKSGGSCGTTMVTDYGRGKRRLLGSSKVSTPLVDGRDVVVFGTSKKVEVSEVHGPGD